jgi:hypothetical protein
MSRGASKCPKGTSNVKERTPHVKAPQMAKAEPNISREQMSKGKAMSRLKCPRGRVTMGEPQMSSRI